MNEVRSGASFLSTYMLSRRVAHGSTARIPCSNWRYAVTMSGLSSIFTSAIAMDADQALLGLCCSCHPLNAKAFGPQASKLD